MPDLQGKPTYPPDDCPVCKGRLQLLQEKQLAWQRRKLEADEKKESLPAFRPPCHRCKNPIPEYLHIPAGYEAQSIDHWHLVVSGGIHSFKMVRDAVCLDCYREDWKKVYPDVPCQV